MITDSQYYEFLRKLLADQRGKNSLNLTEWESQFLGSFSMAQRQTLWLTEGRRKSVDRMWMKYGPDLNLPHPLDHITERESIANADPGCCQYIIKDEGRQRRCNDPAEFQEPGRLLYCRPHAEAVEQECKRANIRIALVAYIPSVS